MSDDIGIFPFVPTDEVEDISDTAIEELPLYREYAYDFERNCLKTGPDGNTYLVEGNEALRIWIYKALRTVRITSSSVTFLLIASRSRCVPASGAKVSPLRRTF